MNIRKSIIVYLLLFSSVFTTPVVAQEVGKDTLSGKGEKEKLEEIGIKEGENSRFFKRAVLPSAVLIGAGVLTMEGSGFLSSTSFYDYRNRSFANFKTDADDFAMLAPLVAMYSINFFSESNRHDLGRQTFLLVASGLVTSAMVWPTKVLTNRERPNGEKYAFPSGHTAYAFTIATFMDKEFRARRPWISVACYTIATATGVVRVLNNAHWMSDVLAGAGVGILSVNIVYWLHAKIARGKALNISASPVMLPTGHMGAGFSLRF